MQRAAAERVCSGSGACFVIAAEDATPRQNDIKTGNYFGLLFSRSSHPLLTAIIPSSPEASLGRSNHASALHLSAYRFPVLAMVAIPKCCLVRLRVCR